MHANGRQVREESDIEQSIFVALLLLEHLSDDDLLEFGKVASFQRYRLVKIALKEESVTMSTLLRLAFFLEVVGYEIKWGEVEEESRYLIRLFAASEKPLEYFLDDSIVRDKYIKYVRGRMSLPMTVSQAVHLVLDFHSPTLKLKIERIHEDLAPIKAKIELKKKPPPELVAKSESDALVTPMLLRGVERVQATASLADVSDKEASLGNIARAERFKGIVENLLEFAKFYTNPDIPETERDLLRRVASQQKIFDLKCELARLCSAKAYREL